VRVLRPFVFLLILVAGCSVAPVATTSNGPGAHPAPTSSGAAIQGKVHGGSAQQPIIGAQIYLLAVSTGSSGTLSTSRMNNTADTSNVGSANGWYYVTTRTDGTFSISASDYTCVTGDEIYLYSLSGNPQAGGTNNTAAGLIAVLGKCTAPGTFSNLPATVQMDEVTTVAAAYALAGFATDAQHIAAPSSTSQALFNAIQTTSNLAALGTGQALSTTPGGNGTVPQTEINTLADILAACINSTGASSDGCSTVLSVKSAGTVGTAPTDTASAAINIAHNPWANIPALYGKVTSSTPFQPYLTGGAGYEPNDFTLAITYTGGGLSQPYGITVDGTGNIWTANRGNSTISEFNSGSTGDVGAAMSGSSGYSGGGLSSPEALAIDSTSANLWITNTGVDSLSKVSTSTPNSGMQYTGGGLLDGDAIAIDQSGKVWVADGGAPRLSEFDPTTSTFPSGSGGFTGGGLNGSDGIAIDSSGNVWVANAGNSSITEFNPATDNFVSGTNGFTGGGLSGPGGIAIDGSGYAWISNATGNTLSEFNSAGAAVSGSGGDTGGGLNSPQGVAIDGYGNVWMVNLNGNSLSEFGSSGTAITGSGGYTSQGGLEGARQIAIDGSGNLWAANSGSGANSITEFVGVAGPVAATPLAPLGTLDITTTSLQSGQEGTPYTSTQLEATGGTTPYTWTQVSGTLPTGLSLSASGVISGTPVSTASNPLVFTVTDSSNPHQQQSVSLTMTISAGSGMTVSVSPRNSGITTHQTLSLTATTNDASGVNWSASGPGCSGGCISYFSSSNTKTGVAVTFTPPPTAGAYTVTATSASETSIAASVNVGVTDLAGVFTYHNDNNRDGANTQEYALNTSNVATGTFGKLFSCTVDSPIYTQPLWVANLTINSTSHNVVFVATTNDSLYAFDADASPCVQLWKVNLLDSAHGGTTGEAPVPSAPTNYLVGAGGGDIEPTVGVIGTPVIDSSTSTLYVVSKSYVSSGPTFYQRLHAISLIDGTEKFSGPANITSAITFPCDKNCTSVAFSPQQENQRCGLALSGPSGTIYVAWASHEDTSPFYGWIMGFNAGNLSQAPVIFNDTPDHSVSTYGAGIWMSGGAPAVDSSGDVYLITGNGKFDATSATKPYDDYGDSFLKLSPTLGVLSYFTPTNQSSDNSGDDDFGSGGATVLVDLPANGTNPTQLIIGGGKNAANKGNFYLLNRANLGGSGDTNAWQQISGQGDSIFATGAFWNYTYYLGVQFQALRAWTLSPSTAKMTPVTVGTSHTFSFPGTTPSVSSTPTDTNGIVWALDTSNYCTLNSGVNQTCGPAVLYAYPVANLGTELWDSGSTAGNAMKFSVPTVANGKVYLSTRGSGTDLDTTTGELDVYGLLP